MTPEGLQFGIAIPQTFREPAASVESLRGFLRRAEDVGFGSLWVQEQLIGRDLSFEPLAMLAYAAACTTQARLCSATFIAPVRNPIAFAKSMATIDQLSLGRLTVGISLGDMRALFPASGVPFGTRPKRLEEMVQVMRRLWTEDRVTFDGEFFSLVEASMEPKPVQTPHPPIWFGGHSEPALRRAARLGDGWIGAGGRSIQEFGEAAATLRTLLAEHGSQGFTIAKKLYIAVGTSREEAFAGLRKWFEVHWGASDAGALAERVGVFGTPSECIERILETWRIGADLIIFNPVFDETQHLETIAAEILPVLRDLAPHDRRRTQSNSLFGG
jgi:probable F420-dependent oxidoreductase